MNSSKPNGTEVADRNTDLSDSPHTVVTGRFSMPHTAFAKALLMRHGLGWAVIMCCMALAAVLASVITSDMRWLLVGLMIVFIVTPLLLAILYFNHGLRTTAVINVQPHRIAVTTEALNVEMFVMPDPDDDTSLERTVRYAFPKADIAPYSTDGEGIFIPVLRPEKGWLFIPYSSFGSPQELKEATCMLLGYTAIRRD